MKKIRLKPLFIIFSLFFAGYANAQDCTTYFPTKEGSFTEMTHFDKKGKETGKTVQKVIKRTEQNGVLKVTIENTFTSDDLDSAMHQVFDMRCENGTFYIDMKSFLNQQSMAAYQNMQISIKSSDIGFPSNMAPGQTLPDGWVTAEINNSGVKMFTMRVDITNRKVEGTEKITTPAGTFDCLKISYNVSSKLILTIKAKGVQYIAKNVGIVKTENLNKKGKLMSYDLLTKISQ